MNECMHEQCMSYYPHPPSSFLENYKNIFKMQTFSNKIHFRVWRVRNFSKTACACKCECDSEISLNSSVFTGCQFEISFLIIIFFLRECVMIFVLKYKQHHFRAVLKGKCQRLSFSEVVNISKALKESCPQLHPQLPESLLYFDKIHMEFWQRLLQIS